jgi:hypothetical protein
MFTFSFTHRYPIERSTLVNRQCTRSFSKSKHEEEEKSIFALLDEQSLTLTVPMSVPRKCLEWWK